MRLTPIMGAENPCVRDCPDRRGGCHAKCEKYAAYETAKKEEYRWRDAERERNAENYARAVSRKKMDRTAREGRRHYR